MKIFPLHPFEKSSDLVMGRVDTTGFPCTHRRYTTNVRFTAASVESDFRCIDCNHSKSWITRRELIDKPEVGKVVETLEGDQSVVEAVTEDGVQVEIIRTHEKVFLPASKLYKPTFIVQTSST